MPGSEYHITSTSNCCGGSTQISDTTTIIATHGHSSEMSKKRSHTKLVLTFMGKRGVTGMNRPGVGSPERSVLDWSRFPPTPRRQMLSKSLLENCASLKIHKAGPCLSSRRH